MPTLLIRSTQQWKEKIATELKTSKVHSYLSAIFPPVIISSSSRFPHGTKNHHGPHVVRMGLFFPAAPAAELHPFSPLLSLALQLRSSTPHPDIQHAKIRNAMTLTPPPEDLLSRHYPRRPRPGISQKRRRLSYG